MTWTKNVPRTQECGRNTTLTNQLFTFCSDSDESLHHRRRMRDTEIDEVPDVGFACCFQRYLSRNQIHGAELCGLRRTRMRYPDQVNKSVCRTDLFGIRIHFERICHNKRNRRWQFRFRSFADDRLNRVPSLRKYWDEPASHITSATGNENGSSHDDAVT